MSDATHQQLPATLAPLEGKLKQLGYVVVPHGAELCVRLPLLCSVRLRQEPGGVRFVPKFGPFGRSTGVAVTARVCTAVIAITALTAGLPATVIVGFAGITALVVVACRFIVTEGALTRLQSLLDRR